MSVESPPQVTPGAAFPEETARRGADGRYRCPWAWVPRI